MLTVRARTAALAVSALLASGCATQPYASVPLERDEREISESEVPPPAIGSLRRQAEGRPIDGFEREDRGDFIAYEGEWELGGVEAEATVLADGSVIEFERELTPDEFQNLPDAIRSRIRELREDGYEIEVERRAFVLFDLGASKPGEDEEMTLLLRPDGRPALRSR